MCVKCENESVTEVIVERFDDVEIQHKVCSDCHEQFLAEVEAEEQAEQEKLELAKKMVSMMDMGARFDITLSATRTEYDKQTAEKVAKGLSRTFGLPYEQNKNGHGWFDLGRYENPISIVIHYEFSTNDEIDRLKKQLASLKGESHEHTA